MTIKLKLLAKILIIIFMISGLFLKSDFVSLTAYSSSLKKEISDLLSMEPALKGGITGISVRSANTGEILFEHNGDLRLRPASNLKLFTAATALSILGKTYQFKTEILTDGLIRNGTLNGNLFIKGYGDPTLQTSDIDQLVKSIKNSGVKVIRGDIVGDDTWYDDVRYSIDLPWSDESTYYGAAVSALTCSPSNDYDAGTVIVEVRPGKMIGDPPIISITPETSYVTIHNRAKTVDVDQKKTVAISRGHGTNTIFIEGAIPIRSSLQREWIGVWEPTQYVVRLFKESLMKHGIRVLGNEKVGVTSQSARVILSHSSIPLSELLISFMKLSNNGHGEMLVKEMGRIHQKEGSWEKGLEVVRGQLDLLGVKTDNLVLRDGSGLSHVNHIPANEISNLLYTIQKEDWFPDFYRSLPLSGSGERLLAGTLSNRLHLLPENSAVSAKTGTLTTVSSLSGYVITKSGQTLIFSIIINSLLDESEGKKIEDKIVTILANQ
ncbi:D-alanyl-D-alanine carboxypeptidase/D-alanyl-D-alanine-endopeptidase [Bacillus salitolerans]|uniref:D-alanyl-D-alanine carboxypeptidase/D-alanyl-D-alanine-endopeptidase n=1 Tax=Bacillus salitolerans TaxID=1437434 RepID=A0ABW4LR87_9BACI